MALAGRVRAAGAGWGRAPRLGCWTAPRRRPLASARPPGPSLALPAALLPAQEAVPPEPAEMEGEVGGDG